MANASFCPLCGEMLAPDDYYVNGVLPPEHEHICPLETPPPDPRRLIKRFRQVERHRFAAMEAVIAAACLAASDAMTGSSDLGLHLSDLVDAVIALDKET